MYYYIRKTLEKTDKLDIKGKKARFVAVLNSAEWLENIEKFKPLEQKGQEVAKYFNMLGAYKLLPSLPKDFFKFEMEKLTANW